MANQFQSSGEAINKAREGTEQLKERAVERVEEMRERALSGKEKLSSRVRRVGTAIHSAGDQIRGEDESWARYADQVSARFERAADYLRTTDPRQAMRDAERFARREPTIFFGGAFLLGLAVSRFFKSSQQSEGPRERESSDTWAPYDDVAPYEAVTPYEDVEGAVH
jgi:hypothetical protein